MLKVERFRLFTFLNFVLSLESGEDLKRLLICQKITQVYQNVSQSTASVLSSSSLEYAVAKLLASPQKRGFWLFSKSEPLTLINTDYCYADGPDWVSISEDKLLRVFLEAKALVENEEQQKGLNYYQKAFFGEKVQILLNSRFGSQN